MSERGKRAIFYGDAAPADTLAPSLVAAAHELKAPLALIRQLALTLEDSDRLGLTADDQTRLMRRIVLSSERSLRLTDTLTKQSRLEDGLFTLEPLNLIHAAQDVAHELQPLAHESGRELRVIHSHVPLALANGELVRQVAFNLCENALQYSRDGQPITLSLASRDHGRTIRLGVRDDGPKGASGALSQLVNTMGTKPQPIADRPHSSGLGLYVASRCAQAMNGTLGLIRHRQGSTFYLDVPVSRQMDIFAA